MECLVTLTGGGLVLLAFITITYIVFQILQKRSEKNKNQKESNTCSSLECVRCNRKLLVLREARRRLTLYILEFGNTGLCRLQDSLRTRFHYTSMCDIRIADDEKYLRNPIVFQLDNLPSSPRWLSGYGSNPHDHTCKYPNGKTENAETIENNHFTSPSVSSMNIPNSLDKDVDTLHNHFEIISEEFHRIWNINGKVRGDWKTNSTSRGQWSLFHLQNQGHWVQENAKYCPRTIDVLSTLPNLMTENVFGNVYFSILYPGTDITEHYGATNIRIRCHLGLLVPENCYLTVGGQFHEWKSGECLLFDDSYLHSAHHHGTLEDGPRIVLLMDLWHPHINAQERQAIECIFPPDIQQNNRNQYKN